MKNVKTFQSNAILAVAMVAAFLSVGSAFSGIGESAVPSVVVVAQRMTESEKHAFDTQLSVEIQTVLIVAKRMPAEEKIATDTSAKSHKAT